MAAIRHRVGIAAPIGDVYEACATPEGIARWWTRDVKGNSKIGGEIAVGFGKPEPAAVMEIVELTPPDRVVWRVEQGPDMWNDTTITFDIRAEGGETVVVFTHAGWREPVEYMHHCSMSWAYFLISMKHGLSGGDATPWPDNEKISTWG